MDRVSQIRDVDYIECLPRPYRANYFKWRERMLGRIEAIVEALNVAPIEEVMVHFGLSARDVALLVRLNYLTEEEAAQYGLERIERSVPV